MVFFFKSNVVSPGLVLFMGADKYENEELLKWGWPEDVWFHVQNYSSAHVYLRLEPGQTIDDIPSAVLDDAAQLVKANSIQGNKLNNIDVIYTMWENLKKTPSMEVGQVAYHKDNLVKKIRVERRINEVVNRLNKTKTEEKPDFRCLREARDAAEREVKKHHLAKQREKLKEEEKRKQEEAELKNYRSLMKAEKMTSNYDDGNDSDDFM